MKVPFLEAAMSVCRYFHGRNAVVLLFSVLLTAAMAYSQASYTAQIRGVVKDQSGAMVTGATVSITNDATGISTTSKTDEHGEYILTGLRPATYTIRAQAEGFRIAEQKNVILQVNQIGRASCRERVRISVGAVSVKQ